MPVVSGPPGYVVTESAVDERSEDGDTASVRTTIDSSAGCEHLVQRVIRFAPGRSRPRRLGDRQEVLFVVSGEGAIEVAGETHRLEPLTGVYVAAGEEYEVEATGPDELVVVSVTAPSEHDAPPSRSWDAGGRRAS